jgi:hypothetical protein
MNDVTQLTPEAQAEAVAALSKAEHDPIVPPQMTRKVWKEMMRIHFTVRRSTVKSCGHKINIQSDPRNNCPDCWFAYFQNNKSVTQIADECFTEAGGDVLERSRGKKFVRYFIRFMSTVARFQREAAEKAKENSNAEENTNSGGSPVTDSSIGRPTGETENVIGVDFAYPSVNDHGAEDSANEGPTDGPSSSLGTV